MTTRSEHRQHVGENLEPEVLFVPEPVRAALEDAALVVQPLDEAEGDLVLRAAVGRDSLPVSVKESFGQPWNYGREAGRAASSSTGGQRSSGNACGPTSGSPR